MQELGISRMTLYRKLSRLERDRMIKHGLCGRPSNNKINPMKERILTLVRNKYFDCGPTLASEFLLDYDDINVNHETLRRWMHTAKLMVRTRKRKPYRQRRVRKPCFNDMLQIDGSFHKWFGGIETCMMNLIDDATGEDLFLFASEETIESACMLLWVWCKKYGIPRSIYSDRRNMYALDNEHKNFFVPASLPSRKNTCARLMAGGMLR
jgi:transposase